MNEASDRKLKAWIEEVASLDMTPWAHLPELDLYMDQVITLMNRQLEPLCVESDRPLTPSMINNYVKDGVMPRPHQKKYNREHLTALSIICMLKAEFSLPEIRELIAGLSRFYSTEELYSALCDTQTDSLQKAAAEVDNAQNLSEADRYLLAMKLSLEANAKRIAAARLLATLTPEPEEKPKDKDKKKKKEKTDETATSE